jgi:hypothetical protein
MRAYLHAQHYGNVTRKRFFRRSHHPRSLAGELREREPVVRWTAGDNTGRIFKLVSLRAQKPTILAFVRNFCVWEKLGDESAPSPNIKLEIGHIVFVASITAKK